MPLSSLLANLLGTLLGLLAFLWGLAILRRGKIIGRLRIPEVYTRGFALGLGRWLFGGVFTILGAYAVLYGFAGLIGLLFR